VSDELQFVGHFLAAFLLTFQVVFQTQQVFPIDPPANRICGIAI